MPLTLSTFTCLSLSCEETRSSQSSFLLLTTTCHGESKSRPLLGTGPVGPHLSPSFSPSLEQRALFVVLFFWLHTAILLCLRTVVTRMLHFSIFPAIFCPALQTPSCLDVHLVTNISTLDLLNIHVNIQSLVEWSPTYKECMWSSCPKIYFYVSKVKGEVEPQIFIFYLFI